VNSIKEQNWWHISDVKTSLNRIYVHLFLVKIFQEKCKTGELKPEKRKEPGTVNKLK
jgi:hypothetical protein